MQAGSPDTTFEAAWSEVTSSHRAVEHQIENELAEAGLPALAWFDVLASLSRSEDPLRPKDMLCQVSVTKSGLTRLVDRMEEAGLIERSYCPSDRRGTFLSLTATGSETLDQMAPIRSRVLTDHFAGQMSEAEAKKIAEVLSRVSSSAVGEIKESCDCEN